MTKLVFSSGWFFLLALVPIANIVFAVMMCIRLAKAFGKGGGYAVGLIFLPFVFYPILAFNSSCVYLGNPAFGAGYGAGYAPLQLSKQRESCDANVQGGRCLPQLYDERLALRLGKYA